MGSKYPEELVINPEKLKRHLVGFIRDELKEAGFSRLVLGVSGGIDSAVVAYLAEAAIGGANVTGVILPYAESHPENIKDAEAIISNLGLNRRFRYWRDIPLKQILYGSMGSSVTWNLHSRIDELLSNCTWV